MIAAVTVAFTLLITPTLVGGQQWAPLLMDNTAILNVPGRSDVNPYGWGDSYSVGTSCYCKTNFDHDIDVIVTSTPFGNMTIKQICTLLGPGPGWTGRPRYNDIQCGHGPPNDAGDEDTCPGRIEYGREGCKYIGPKWDFSGISIAPVKPPASAPVKASVPTPIGSPVKPPVPAPVKVSNPVSAPVAPPAVSTGSILIDAQLKSGPRFNITGSTTRNSVDASVIKSSIVGFSVELFRVHRYGSGFSYHIKGMIPGKFYSVTFGFAETYVANCQLGKRVFSIEASGTVLVSNLDVFAAAGCQTAYTITKPVLTSGKGTMDIKFVKLKENPFISFIHVVPV